jgi:hypothetical protein
VAERGAVEPGEDEHVLEGAALTRVDVDEGPRRLVHVREARGPGVQLERAEVRHPGERRDAVHHAVPLGLPLVGLLVAPALEPGGGVARHLLVPEAGTVGTPGEPVQVDRPVEEVREHARRDHRVVPDQVSLGHRRTAVAGGEEDLVEVRDLQLPVPAPATGPARRARPAPRAPRPSAGPTTAPRASRRGWRPRPPGGRSATAPPVPPPPRRWCDRSDRRRVVLGIPPRHGVLVGLVQQQPLLLARSRPGRGGSARTCRRASRRRGRSGAPRADWPRHVPGAGGDHVPQSQTMTSPPPYSPFGMTPSKSKYSIGWSSTCTASCRAVGSRVGPFGTAQLTSTPSTSRRRS